MATFCTRWPRKAQTNPRWSSLRSARPVRGSSRNMDTHYTTLCDTRQIKANITLRAFAKTDRFAVRYQSLNIDCSMRALIIAFRVDDAKCIVVTRVCVRVSVCLSVCPRPHAHTLLHGTGCNMGEWYRECPRICAPLGGFVIGARVALLWQHNANVKC